MTMDKINIAPQAPTTAKMTTTSVTNAATATLGDGKGGIYLFTVTGPAVDGTVDWQDVTVWVSFSAPGATPTTPVAGTTGYPLAPFQQYAFTLGDRVKFMAISDTTTMNLTWGRVSDE
jgi:hypothetical protein